MAELHIQKKQTNVWPWIIGLLVVAAVVWFAFGRTAMNDNTASRAADTTYQTTPPVGTTP